MNVAELIAKLEAITAKPLNRAEFAYQLLEAFDAPRATISKLRNGTMNKGEMEGDVLWKGKLFFRPADKGAAATTIDALKSSKATKTGVPRILLSTDGDELSALDTKRGESLHIEFAKLPEHFDFFYPLAGLERYRGVEENPADVKAADKLAKFYDAILDENPEWRDEAYRHALNLFMTRTLFCMFAEDTKIFDANLFTGTVDDFTLEDGSDTHQLLKTLYDIMDHKDDGREGYPSFARDFPYVNGGLFREKTEVPRFSKKARRLLIEAAQLDWAEINPDIFGSMIQAVVDPSMRGDLGMHYTSVPNIMKLIKPLFLDRLHEEFEAAKDNAKRLEKLLTRIYRIRVFDPACGSGNFLIISYRELRRLEMRIFKRLQEIAPQFSLPMSQVRLSQFYGIEYADFAAETAKLSLWIAEYQANREFEDTFGSSRPSLPLKDSGNVISSNALRVDWLSVVPDVEHDETYIVGNPPYLGSTNQSADQKTDMALVFSSYPVSSRNLDYVAGWLIKGAEFCRRRKAELALVTTNSICQGEQVSMLWPHVLGDDLEIGFAHRSFKWKNNAAHAAGVTCIVVNVRIKSGKPKYIISGNVSTPVANISAYLTNNHDIIIQKLAQSLCEMPPMLYGSKPVDGGNLILNDAEQRDLEKSYPSSLRFIRKFSGSQEFIKGLDRWCLWIEDSDLEEALQIEPVAARIRKTEIFRLNSSKVPTQKLASKPHRFGEVRYTGRAEHTLIIPSVTSERRAYIPCGIIPNHTVVSNSAFTISDGPIWVLAILSSRLHAVWIETVCGQLRTDIRYSNTLGYNTFPVPNLSDKQRSDLEEAAWRIVAEREANPGKTISQLYDPKTMPQGLLEAHQDLDTLLETIYRGRPFNSDAERLEHLFKLYAAKTQKTVDTQKGRAA